MPLPLIPSQSIYLYTNSWTQEMDTFFIHALVSYKNESGRLGSDIPNYELMKAQRALNSHFGCRFTEEELIHRVEILAQRYHSFKKLGKHNGVQFHAESNTIIAKDATWEKIFERNHFAKAYYHNGEPEFTSLCILFGMEDIKREEDKNVIVLSDSTTKQNEFKNEFNHVDEDDEVTSPIPIATRRKLFDCDAMDTNMDQESTSNARPYQIRQAATSSRRFPSSVNLFKNIYSSSCGSSSPSPKKK